MTGVFKRMVLSKSIRLISIVVLLFFVHSTQAALINTGPTAADGDSYPYTQTITEGAESFDVQMDGTPLSDPSTHLYVSTFAYLDGVTIGIMKTLDAPTNNVSDYRQINPDEELHMTFSNIPTGKLVTISALSGMNTYFPVGMELYLSKDGQLVNTIYCNGNASGTYSIVPPIQASNGDTVSLNPTGNIRLRDFTASLVAATAAYNPSPLDGASDVNVDLDLSWSIPSALAGALSNVYFGTSPNPPLVSSGQAGTLYETGTMDYLTDYYWKIDLVDGETTYPGAEWTFTTASQFGPVETWDVASSYGTTGADLQAAVNDAVDYRNSNPNDTIILDLAAGTFTLEEEINIDNLPANGTGWLIIQGQGIDQTELIDTEYTELTSFTFRGSAVHRLKICDMSITGERLTSSQGTLVGFTDTTLDIDLDVGFPIPTELFETDTGKANKVRLMDDPDPADPTYHFVEGPDNDHYSNRVDWQGSDNGTLPTLVSNRVWRFYLRIPSHPYQVGDRLAVSSKSTRSNWGFFANGGSDMVFENIRLKKLGRIKLRQDGGPDIDGVTFRNVSIVRPVVNGIPAMYSTDAGPQIGHGLATGMVYNVLIENCDFRGTTDDGTAFERVNDGVVRNNYWEDGGGVYVATASQPGLVFSNNVYYHCPLEDNRPGGVHYKGAYDFYPANREIDVSKTVTLSWTAGTDAESHDVYFGTVNPPPFLGNQPDTTYGPITLQAGMAYYWRVNEKNSVLGSNLGDLLYFTTLPCDLNTDGDFNDDCAVDLLDLELMAAHWLQPVFPECSQCDINGDGDINMEDYSALSQNWLQEF